MGVIPLGPAVDAIPRFAKTRVAFGGTAPAMEKEVKVADTVFVLKAACGAYEMRRFLWNPATNYVLAFSCQKEMRPFDSQPAGGDASKFGRGELAFLMYAPCWPVDGL